MKKNPLNNICYRNFADLPIRLMIGFHLIYGSQDNIFSYTRMREFEDFLRTYHMPFPLLAAHLSVYAQFISGICFILGYQTRIAAMVMVINFIIAIIVVHVNDTYISSFPAIVMLSGAIFLALFGSGSLSLDHLTNQPRIK